MQRKLITLVLVFALGLVISSCRKTTTPTNDNPTNFVDLKVSESFTFDNFKTLDFDISSMGSTPGGTNLFQLFQGEPTKGKLIATGIAIGEQHFSSSTRLPLALKEVYIRHVGPEGNIETAIVDVTTNEFSYVFGMTKSTDDINSCGTGTAITTNQNSVNVSSGSQFYVPYGATVTIKNLNVSTGGIFNNCGTLTVEELNTSATDGVINNNGTITFEEDVDLKGTFNNDGTLNVIDEKEFKLNSGGHLINNCTMFFNGEIKTTGSGAMTNNGYIKYNGNSKGNNEGKFKIAGGGGLILGPQSLIDVLDFELLSTCVGPTTSASYAGIKTVDGKTTGGTSMDGYVVFCATGNINPDRASYGSNVTTDCTLTPAIPSCTSLIPPTITSPLTAAGTVGQSFSYVITATGTETITFNASNLSGTGLTYNSTTHTISGTLTTAGTFNIPLTADNMVGTDNKTLVLTVGAAGVAPTITSPATASGTSGQAFSYTITATGTNTTACPITYSATPNPLPAGLTLNGSVISGTLTGGADTYTIILSATNCEGTGPKTLTLDVAAAGVAPNITSSLSQNGTVGVPFTYTLTADGTAPLYNWNATSLPGGLSFDASTRQITGNPNETGNFEVNLTVSNDFGDDNKTLNILIIPGAGTPPVLQPPFTVMGTVGIPFTPYIITATGSDDITYGVTDLPDGLRLDVDGRTIIGNPTVSGTFIAHLTAQNSIGDDYRDLTIIIASSGGGSSVSYYPNEVDYGTFVFEDLWPYYGDYDMNDLVVNFQYKITSNDQNEITDIEATFIFKAAGADLNNGFGFVLYTDPSNIESVSGCTQYGNAVTYDPKGYEAGHSNMTVIIPVDAINTMFGRGFVNTIPDQEYIEPEIKVIDIHFSTPQAFIGDLPWNPFIFQNQVRSHEIHLKNQPGTDFADQTLFDTGDDGSNPAQDFYYTSTTGLPWAFEIPVDFAYPNEKADILQAYLHFAEWAQTSGVDYDDWYEDKNNYRNDANIYVIP